MKKLATKLTPAIKAWIKEEFGYDYGSYCSGYFHFPKYDNFHLWSTVLTDYTEVSEHEFLAEFEKPKERIYRTFEMQYRLRGTETWREHSLLNEFEYRIKPTPDYSKEIEALQAKAKENGMKVTINFEKL